MNHEATMQRACDLIDAGGTDAFGDLLGDDFVEHEEMSGLGRKREGVENLFRMHRATFTDFRLTTEDVLACGDKVVAGCERRAPT